LLCALLLCRRYSGLEKNPSIQNVNINSRIAAASLIALLAACTESTAPTAPDIRQPGIPANTASAVCTVDVKALSLTCTEAKAAAPASGLKQAIVFGGQDLYVKLTSSGTSYDGGTQVLRSDVTVQNLLQQMIGTTDGMTPTGVKIFLHTGPTVTSGTGIVTVANADGTSTFTAGGQPYFNYSQIIDSYEISSQREWQFNVPSTVDTFVFTVLISADVADEMATYLDRLWKGTASAAWENAANWNGGVPIATSTVAVPPPSMITSGNQPVLGSSTTIKNFRVALGSTLGLGGNTLTITDNLDAPGTISDGIVRMTGSDVFLGGNLDKLEITGNAKTQRSTFATGAVSVSGSLSVRDNALSISIQ